MDSNSALSNNQIGPNSVPAGNAQQGTAPIATSQTPNTDLMALVPKSSAPIDSAKLPGAQPVQTPTPPSNTIDTFVNSLQVGNPNSGLPGAPELKKNVDTAQAETDQTSKDINDLMVKLGYKSADTAKLQEGANISGLTSALSDLNTQFAQKKSAYDAQFQRIGAQNIPTLFVTGQQAIARAAAASDLGATAAEIQAAQGNLSTAFETIDKTISQKYQPIIDQIDQKLKFYDINQDKLTKAQSILATRQADILGLQKEGIANQQKIISDSIGVIKDAIGKVGLDQASAFKAISNILGGKISPSEALASLGLSNSVVSGGSLANAISSVESGGSYDAVGKTISKGENAGFAALGKYQIMPNIWFPVIGLDASSEADKQKFLSTPTLQDQLFQTIITTLTNKYGDEAKAIAAYFGGDNAAKAYGTPEGDRISDGNMTVNQYVDAVLGKYNEQNKPEYGQYGLLANTDFNPGNRVDSAAKQYLDYYIKNATFPTAYSIFGKDPRGLTLAQVANRAQDLFFDATGQALPDVTLLKSNKGIIAANNKLENNLNIQEGTVAKNFKLALDNISKNGINQSIQPINAFLNEMKNLMGDPDVAQYLTQNATLKNEVSSLLSLKNASGTTVADKLEAAGLVPKNASEKQQIAILKILLQEAENGFDTIKETSGNLYSQIDPLQTDPNNPNRKSPASSANGSADIKSVKDKYGLDY